jgi:phenylalanyl-tRNA synthetase beta chain
MNISHDWLRAFVPHALSPLALGELLSRHVATLDGISPLRADLSPIVVARVVESEGIPGTKLSFNKVDDGSGTLLEVVCGAPNVAVGTLYPFARAGTVMPDGTKIEKRKIRGFGSNGMLCSARELRLGTDHDGILELDIDVPTGTALLAAMAIGDTRLDLDVLPNRPDLLSHYGVAREVSALVNVPLQLAPELDAAPRAPKSVTGVDAATGGEVSVTVEDMDGCGRYVAVAIRGIKVGASPAWLRERVESVGARSINNVVDATNYILHGLGQPVHAFDLARLMGSGIVVRKAKKGETLVTLDGVERKLEPWMTIIADQEHPVALAGVMGGRASEVTDATTTVLLEVANFAPRDVRKVRRALGLSTDASYRFERGVDAGSTAWTARIAAGLIVSVAGGAIDAVLEVGTPPTPSAPIDLRPQRVERLLGAAVSGHEIEQFLSSIGFAVVSAKDGSMSVGAPSWRFDVSRDVDLVEEIARLRGYDVLPDAVRPYRPSGVPDHPVHVVSRRVRDALVGNGLAEARPLPFTKGDTAAGAACVRVMNPLTEEEPFLRSSVVDTLARRAEYNLSRQQGNVRLFEIGDAFSPSGDGLPHEEVRVAALVMGERRPPHFTEPKPPKFDAWDAKSLAESIARAAFPGEQISLLPGEGNALWMLRAGSREVGFVCRVPLDAPVWASPAFGVEITIGLMPSTPVAKAGSHAYKDPSAEAAGSGSASASMDAVRYEPLPTMPAAEFDLALLVPNDMPVADVERVIRGAGGDLLESTLLFDEFRGAGIPEGMRSLAWRLTFRHPERTLRDKEIDGRRSQLLRTLEKELGVVPRTA